MGHPADFDLDTKSIGALPLVNLFLDRLRFAPLLLRHLPAGRPRSQLAAARALGVVVRNLVVAREPLYRMEEWAQDIVPSLLGLAPEQMHLVNDDPLGRALDRLFDADCEALLTDLVVQMVREFDVSLDQLHNDSTTLALHGDYHEATGRPVRGKPTPKATFGHSKDHRPDLKQLLWILTVSADGATPVHFKTTDGNTEDATTHVDTWQALRRLVGSADFLYVADSKACTRPTLKHIHDNGGRFITVMPRTRAEDRLFRDWLQTNTPAWEEVARKPHPRLRDGPPDIFFALLSPIPDSDGFRVAWYLSSHKIQRDAGFRHHAIRAAWLQLERLRAKLEGPRPRYRTRAAVAEVVEKILPETKAVRWIRYQVTETQQTVFRQEKPGRPGKKTRYRKVTRTRFKLDWGVDQDQVAYDARCDGIFPLITNCPEEALSAAQILEIYKSKQPLVEKRHDLVKNVELATPMYLKSISRMVAVLFLFFVSSLVHALIEREIRRGMKARGLRSLRLYPEDRACKAPTTRRILEIFEKVQRHLLLGDRGQLLERFDPRLSHRQLLVLRMLGLSPGLFLNL